MLRFFKKLIHKLCGEISVPKNFDEIIQQRLDEKLNYYIPKNFDEIIQQRLDEKLNYYFKWRFPLHIPDSGHTFIHTNDGHRLHLDNKETFMALHLLEHGEWETHVRREMKNRLFQGATFVDIGANIGLHSLYATILVGTTGKIIALEPIPRIRKILHNNIEINGLLDRVSVLPYAVSNENNGVVSFEYFNEHPGMSGLKVSKIIVDNFEGTINVINVETITIDSLIEKYELVPDLIKIDVEGFEYAVIQGAANTIKKYPKVSFLLEYGKILAEHVIGPEAGKQISDFFKERNFKIYRVTTEDLLFINYSDFSSEEGGDYIFTRQ